ncbi:hypothetical protein N7495_000469 [Penicillium taxi]|uniref:uncharacterized protein n=1 Tax=Penicillium taxi TaxID=168475 RepID=UPI002545527C|nr:uncharacterized protein N7495_000469 [Penicillium taxi]KAJ5907787.1 hypothetical protein N7495_000469 [Penicillium taxi]
MAAPADITIKNFTGQWVMDTTQSDPFDPILGLQGVSWLLRKALGYATVTLHIREYTDPKDSIYHIDIQQVVTGGIKGNKEERKMDWVMGEHKDNVFGRVIGCSRFICGIQDEDGKFRPALDLQTKVAEKTNNTIKRFLRGEIFADGSTCEGFIADADVADEELSVQSWVVNATSGWTAEQVWGFEIIDGKRYHTRRVAVAKGSKLEMARLVYTFIGHELLAEDQEDNLAYK